MANSSRTHKPARGAGAQILSLPARDEATIDVRSALLKNQSAPTVLVPKNLQTLVDHRARELAEEAYQLCREHLMRRIAYHGECGSPRTLDEVRAKEVLREGGLGHALARVWHMEMCEIAHYASLAAFASRRFEESMQAAMKGSQVNPRS